ncbi:MAG: hypothetical protein FJ290_32895 [Planctomycetes bacterium]|nr:hypothetical protein [Planctomycetota bacterium]
MRLLGVPPLGGLPEQCSESLKAIWGQCGPSIQPGRVEKENADEETVLAWVGGAGPRGLRRGQGGEDRGEGPAQDHRRRGQRHVPRRPDRRGREGDRDTGRQDRRRDRGHREAQGGQGRRGRIHP